MTTKKKVYVKKKPANPSTEPCPLPPEAQSERIMLSLTPAEKTRLEKYAAEMSASVGMTVGLATAARALVMRQLRLAEGGAQ